MTPRSRFDADPEAEATIEALRRRYQQQPPRSHFGWLGLLIAVFLGYLCSPTLATGTAAPQIRWNATGCRRRLPARCPVQLRLCAITRHGPSWCRTILRPGQWAAHLMCKCPMGATPALLCATLLLARKICL